MSFMITALGKNAGAEVTGVDLSKPLPVDDRQQMRAALVKHIALVFRDQKLDQDQYADAVRNFGEPLAQNFVDDRLDNPCVSLVSNAIPGVDGKRVYHASYWHTDHTNRNEPPAFTALYAVELPTSGGGDTGILNMRAAFKNLSPTMRRRIENLHTVNVYSGSAARIKSHKAATLKHSDEDKPCVHPLIRTHPDTGDKAIYLHKGKLEQFEGMSPEDSQTLVDELMQEVEKPEYIYRHKWQKGDLLIWDDRASMHQAFSDYDLQETRMLYRIIAEPQRPY
ncbi:MAG: TauD/TfdA dioxygenase family protein [Rhodospirillales bacterium]|jgi:taurine dioxygenase